MFFDISCGFRGARSPLPGGGATVPPPLCSSWGRAPVLQCHRNPDCSEPCLQHPSPKLSDSLFLVSQVCREYQRGNCNRGENDCRFAHPADSAMIDTNDNTVTVCMDYIKGRCSREKCKYFHPPAHLQAKIKAAQYQVNQAAAAQAAATAAAMVSWEATSGTQVC